MSTKKASTVSAVKERLIFAQMSHTTKTIKQRHGKDDSIRRHFISFDAWGHNDAPVSLSEEVAQDMINEMILPYLKYKFPSLDHNDIIKIEWSLQSPRYSYYRNQSKTFKVTIDRPITAKEKETAKKRIESMKKAEARRLEQSSAHDARQAASRMHSITQSASYCVYPFNRKKLSRAELAVVDADIASLEKYLNRFR